MRIVAMILIAVLSGAQARPTQRVATRPSPDELGMTCDEILNMSSTDWIAKFTSAKGADAPAAIRAINVYGKCYDTRTDELAGSLAKSGKGPTPNGRANFQNVDGALKNFTAKALIDSEPAADAVKSAYAALYEKQFRYEFYEAYKSQSETAVPVSGETSAAKDGAIPSSKDAGNSAVPSGYADKDETGDPVTDAKNHFGGLLNDLPDDKLRDLHIAFGEILGPNAATPRMQLLIYRYAIFLLEPPGGQPFSPPPF